MASPVTSYKYCSIDSASSDKTRERISLVSTTIKSLRCVARSILNQEPINLGAEHTKNYYNDVIVLFKEMLGVNQKFYFSDLAIKISQWICKNEQHPEKTSHEVAYLINKFALEFTAEFAGLGVSVYLPTFTISNNDRSLCSLYPYLLEKTMTCFEYAVYHLNLYANTNEPFINQCNPTLSPRAGDVVLYGDPDFTPTTFTHVGIYLSSNTILSKWGESPEVYVHKLDSLLSLYGNNVMFVRKKVKFECEELFIKKIQALETNEFSPLTLSGLNQHLIDYFEVISVENLRVVFENSMFGKRALRKYSKVVLTQLRKPENLEMSRPQFLSHMKAMCKGLSDDQRIVIPTA